MARIKKSVTVNASVDRVFEYTTDANKLLEIWPSLVEVSNVERKPDGSHSFDWVYKMAGIRFKGHAETTEAQLNRRVVTKNEKGIPSTFRWDYTAEDGKTKVDLDVEYTLPNKLLDKLAAPFIEKVNDREAETILRNLKERMESGEVAAAQ